MCSKACFVWKFGGEGNLIRKLNFKEILGFSILNKTEHLWSKFLPTRKCLSKFNDCILSSCSRLRSKQKCLLLFQRSPLNCNWISNSQIWFINSNCRPVHPVSSSHIETYIKAYSYGCRVFVIEIQKNGGLHEPLAAETRGTGGQYIQTFEVDGTAPSRQSKAAPS